MGDSAPPSSSNLEFDFTRAHTAFESEPPLALESPLPLCLTDGAPPAQQRKNSPIPGPPRLPRISDAEEQAPGTGAPLDISDLALSGPADRIAAGSAALVSTFRPKPAVRSCYSVTRSSIEERVYRTRRAVTPGRRVTKKPAQR